MPTSSSPYVVLFTSMLIALMSTAGIALPYPILAPLFLGPDAAPIAQFGGIDAKLLFAMALAVYPLGMLIGSAMLGSLSDQYGRKPVLLASLWISALSYLLTVVALAHHHYGLFVLARFLTGLFEGNMPIIRAIAADLHPRIDKTRAYSWMMSVTYAGWLIGPLAGGYLMQFGVVFAFEVAGAAILLSAMLAWALIPAAPAPSHAKKTRWWRDAINNNAFSLLSHSAIRPFFRIQLLLALGLSGFYEFYPLWLVERMQFDALSIGHATALLTGVMVATGAMLVEPLSKTFGQAPMITLSLWCCALAFAVAPLIDAPHLYGYFIMIGVTIALYNSLLPVYLSDRFEHLGQGRLMGLLSATFYLANVVIALLGGLISLLGSEFSIMAGGLLTASAALLFVIRPAPQVCNR